MVDKKIDENKRRFLKALTGGIAGLSIPMSIYEGAIIPEIERKFNEELTGWLIRYNLADKKLKELQSKYQSAKDTLSNFEQFENKLNEQIKLYNQIKDEAINKMKETINKYEILGIEVNFEKSAVKILEDLKIKGDKLLKYYKYSPLIVDLYWKPTKIINDKIYDINVSFEVISPLNTLKEVEIMLIPVEYRYFITKYGMREEDYYKVFPKEEIRTIKLQPKGLEREMFNVTFADLKGGREYLIKAVAKDVADSINSEEIKTPYIREFENKAKNIKWTILADYYTWFDTQQPGYRHWRDEEGRRYIYTPLLGEYDSGDSLVIAKHIDWATGHGISVLNVSWWTTGKDERWYDYYSLQNFMSLLEHPMMKNVRFCILYEANRLKTTNRPTRPIAGTVIDVDDEYNRNKLIEDFKFLREAFFVHPQYYRIDGKPVVTFDRLRDFIGNIEEVFEQIRIAAGDIYIVNDILHLFGWDQPHDDIFWLHIKKINSISNAISCSGGGFWPYAVSRVREPYIKGSVKPLFDYIEEVYSELTSRFPKLALIPVIHPGMEALPRTREPYYIPLKRTEDTIFGYIKLAKKYATRGMIKLNSFNNWDWGDQIEPSSDEKEFNPLNIIGKEFNQI
jgi:hypothetical protein